LLLLESWILGLDILTIEIWVELLLLLSVIEVSVVGMLVSSLIVLLIVIVSLGIVVAVCCRCRVSVIDITFNLLEILIIWLIIVVFSLKISSILVALTLLLRLPVHLLELLVCCLLTKLRRHHLVGVYP